MSAPVSSAEPQRLTASEARSLCGDILDWKVEAIVALRPTAGDVATAVAWANGQDELGKAGKPLAALAAQVYDLLMADAFPEEAERR
jgi:hypothetical protein